MGKVAAIQMTSSHVVADNLVAAGELLREAKDAGADIACLPENFAFYKHLTARELLRLHLTELLGRLVDNGLLQIQPADVGTASAV